MFHTEDVGLVGASEVQVGLGAFMEAVAVAQLAILSRFERSLFIIF